MKKWLLFMCAIALFQAANCQSKFENTLRFSDTQSPPIADLNAISWIQGYWRGEAFGGFTEEVWTPPLGGSMMCAFKLVVGNEIKFYELVTIVEANETLILRLKHFNSDLKGWEKQDQVQEFRLVKVSDQKVYFDGFTFERLGENRLNVYVVINEKGVETEAKFSYTKAKIHN